MSMSKENELNWVFGFASTVSSEKGAFLGENTKLSETPSIRDVILDSINSVSLSAALRLSLPDKSACKLRG